MSADVYFEEKTTIDNSNYDDDHKYVLGNKSSTSWSILYKSGTSPIFFSFDGTEDAGVVSDLPGYHQFQLLEPWVTTTFWLRGGTGDEIVEITARAQ